MPDYELFSSGFKPDFFQEREKETKGKFYCFFNNLDALRTSQKLCDLVVQVEEQTFLCHKIILAASSEYFRGLLGGDFQESKQDQIRLDTVSAEAFETILSYLYTRSISINDKNATELLIASDFLGISYIYKLCYKHIEIKYTTIPTENILEVFQFFFSTRELDTRFICLFCEYLGYNCSILLRSSLFTEISSRVWNSVLEIVDLQKNGDEIVEAIIRWVNYKLDDRKVHLLEMIEMIKFGTTDASYLKVLEKFAADCNQSDVISSGRKLMSSNSISNSSLHMFFSYSSPYSVYTGIVALDHKLEWKCYSRKNEIPYYIDGKRTQVRITRSSYNIRSVSGENLYHVYYNSEKIIQIHFLRSSLTNMNKRILLKCPPKVNTSISLCSVQDKVYLYYPSGGTLDYCRSDVYLYQSERDTWFSVPVPPLATQLSMLVSCNGILYLVGSGLCRYDSRMQNWEILPSMHYHYIRPVTCECNGKIYVCSGESMNVECYDPVANKWTQIAGIENMSIEGCKGLYGRWCNPGLASHHDLVWVLRKYEYCNTAADDIIVDVYNPRTNSWSNFKSPTMAMTGPANNKDNRVSLSNYWLDDFINIT